jgi:3-dehydroquinate dehydratase-2
MRILLINGPSLNTLGTREPEIYGSLTLDDIVQRVSERAKELGTEVRAFQSNHEGGIIDFIQQESSTADGMILNGGALTHYGLSLRDALAGAGIPTIEVHISNIYAREPFRRRSLTGGVCRGVITGLGWYGYILALEALVHDAKSSPSNAG